MRYLPFLLLAVAMTGPARGEEGIELVEVKKIWDQAPHNAFTDLIRFRDRWFCVFREGQGHVSPDGALRVITSSDGEHWESAALLTSPHSDLRDAKISVTPDGQLMLAGAETLPNPTTHRIQSLVWFSPDGRSWSRRHEVADPDFWLWRITWHKGKAYGFGYGCGKDNRGIRLYASSDGKSFQTLVSDVPVEGTYPNETSLVFLPDDTAYCLLRQDGEPRNGYLGVSRPPYTEWTWKRRPNRRSPHDRVARRAVVGRRAIVRRSGADVVVPDRSRSGHARGMPCFALRRGYELRRLGAARRAAVGQLLFVARGQDEHLSGQGADRTIPTVTASPSPDRAGDFGGVQRHA